MVSNWAVFFLEKSIPRPLSVIRYFPIELGRHPLGITVGSAGARGGRDNEHVARSSCYDMRSPRGTGKMGPRASLNG